MNARSDIITTVISEGNPALVTWARSIRHYAGVPPVLDDPVTVGALARALVRVPRSDRAVGPRADPESGPSSEAGGSVGARVSSP